MKILNKVWNQLFNTKKINGKEWINKSMTEKYGAFWLEGCMEGLKNKEVRESVAKELNLKKNISYEKQ